MKIEIRRTLTIGAAALGLLALPSFAMAAGGDDMRGGARMGHMDHDGGMGRMGGGRGDDERMGGGRMGGERMGGGERFGRGGNERGEFGRSAGNFGGDRGDHGVREFRERVRDRQFGREDRVRGFREPARERVRVVQRYGYGGGYHGYDGGYHGRRVGYGDGYPGRGYGPAFRRPVAYGFGYGRPRGRLVRICTVRFVPYR